MLLKLVDPSRSELNSDGHQIHIEHHILDEVCSASRETNRHLRPPILTWRKSLNGEVSPIRKTIPRDPSRRTHNQIREQLPPEIRMIRNDAHGRDRRNIGGTITDKLRLHRIRPIPAQRVHATRRLQVNTRPVKP